MSYKAWAPADFFIIQGERLVSLYMHILCGQVTKSWSHIASCAFNLIKTVACTLQATSGLRSN